MERWNGRVALVTGASAGIGSAICKALVQSGMIVVGAARSLDKMKAIAEELTGAKGSLMPVRCDVTKDEDVYSLFKTIKEAHGGVDICVNNAGMSFNNSLLDGTPEEWRTMMDVNGTIALCLCTKLAIASMRERAVDDGQIINIIRDDGHRVSGEYPEFHFYGGTKFAMKAITEGLRQELREAKSRIRVSSISPGFVETDFLMRFWGEEKRKELNASLKVLRGEDIAAILLHIISSPPHVEINDVLVRPTAQKT